MYIYKITCLVNDKVYIGQTSEDIELRFKRHKWHSQNSDTKFYRAIRKYGIDNFKIEIIDTASNQDELDRKEVEWINHYNSCYEGYNTKTSQGKCGGDTLSNHPNIKEIKKKLRESKLGDNNPMKEAKNSSKISGNKNGMAGRFGGLNPWATKIVALNEDMSLYKIYDSQEDAIRDLGYKSRSPVNNRVRGIVKSHYKGLYFKYYKNYISDKV